jgi:hypothetical protein
VRSPTTSSCTQLLPSTPTTCPISPRPTGMSRCTTQPTQGGTPGAVPLRQSQRPDYQSGRLGSPPTTHQSCFEKTVAALSGTGVRHIFSPPTPLNPATKIIVNIRSSHTIPHHTTSHPHNHTPTHPHTHTPTDPHTHTPTHPHPHTHTHTHTCCTLEQLSSNHLTRNQSVKQNIPRMSKYARPACQR